MSNRGGNCTIELFSPIRLESGGELDASLWDSIATVVHKQLMATVVTYHRVGFGKSILDTTNDNILKEIKSLEAALETLGIWMLNLSWLGIRKVDFISSYWQRGILKK